MLMTATGRLFMMFLQEICRNIQFYGTLFIDSGSIRGLLSGDFHEWWYGYTLGVKKVNAFIPNLNLTVEYTRIGAWVYDHKYDTETYTAYWLCAWRLAWAECRSIEDSGRIQIYKAADISLYYERIRKGGLADIS